MSRADDRKRQRVRHHAAQRRSRAPVEVTGGEPDAKKRSASTTRTSTVPAAPPPTPGSRLREVVVIGVVALALAFVVQAVLVKTYRIPSGSMEPTLKIGERVLVNRIGTHFGSPSVGDIVVFHPPHGADEQPPVCDDLLAGAGTSRLCARATGNRSAQTFIKRVVGVGGDHIAVRGGHVIRNGKREGDDYIRPCGAGAIGCESFAPITVPKGSVYVMGDNRGGSDDSRFWGPVKLGWIIGKAFASYWPPSRMGIGF